MMTPESKAKWLTDSNKRKYLLQKANLIDLFTIADLPVIDDTHSSGNKNRNIGDIVEFNEYNYQGYTMVTLDSNNVLYPNYNKDTIILTVFNEEFDKYTLNNIYTIKVDNDINDYVTYKVLKIATFNNFREHPYIDTLTPDLKQKLYNTLQYQVVKLERVLVKEQYKGYDLFTDKAFVFGVDYETSTHDTRYIVLSKYGEPAFSIYDELVLHNGDIENYTTPDTTITTTIGRYLTNYFALAVPFGNVINYINGEFNIGKVEKQIAEKIKSGELTTEQGGQYLDNMFFIGSFGEMAIPGLTRKSLTVSPEVKKRKKELLEKYKDQLHDPIICAQIEDELIKLDKEWLKGDPSMGFYGNAGKKFNVNRKKQYVIGGLIEDFTKEKGKYDFIKNSLSEGWEIDSFVTICNEIRKGSYNRGIDTANGGTLSKRTLRVVQDLKITSEDCGTQEYLEIILTKEIINKFLGRWVLNPSNNELEILTNDNKEKYLDKLTKIRSFMYCKQHDGFCHKCGGVEFGNIGQDVVGVLALELTSTFTKMSLKAMHGVKLNTGRVSSLNSFVI